MSDEDLVKAVIGDEPSAWESFLRQHGDLIYSFCTAVFPKHQVEQEFLNVLEGIRADDFALLRSFDGRAKLSTYLTLKIGDLLAERILAILSEDPAKGQNAFERFFKKEIQKTIMKHFPTNSVQDASGDGDSVQSLYQQALEHLFKDDCRRLKDYDGRGSLVSYVRQIVGNFCLDHVSQGSSTCASSVEKTRLALADSSFVSMESDCPASPPAAFYRVVSSMQDIAAAIAVAESAGLARDEIFASVTNARKLLNLSPFVRRLRTWPRGYPGDFETIEQIITQRNDAPENTLGYWIEQYCLASPISQQHRNKIQEQARIIAKTVTREKPANSVPATQGSSRSPTRVLVMACGSCADLRLAEPTIKPASFTVVLNDADEGAIEFSLAHLDGIRDRVQTAIGNVLQRARTLGSDGKFDLVVAGGLFDYLDDRAAKTLIRIVFDKLLVRDGVFFFTNIGKGNPYRPWMEYLADWTLIERSDEDIKTLVEAASPNTPALFDMEIFTEGTGLTKLIRIKKR